jgi:hypothetical protein
MDVDKRTICIPELTFLRIARANIRRHKLGRVPLSEEQQEIIRDRAEKALIYGDPPTVETTDDNDLVWDFADNHDIVPDLDESHLTSTGATDEEISKLRRIDFIRDPKKREEARLEEEAEEKAQADAVPVPIVDEEEAAAAKSASASAAGPAKPAAKEGETQSAGAILSELDRAANAAPPPAVSASILHAATIGTDFPAGAANAEEEEEGSVRDESPTHL